MVEPEPSSRGLWTLPRATAEAPELLRLFGPSRVMWPVSIRLNTPKNDYAICSSRPWPLMHRRVMGRPLILLLPRAAPICLSRPDVRLSR